MFNSILNSLKQKIFENIRYIYLKACHGTFIMTWEPNSMRSTYDIGVRGLESGMYIENYINNEYHHSPMAKHLHVPMQSCIQKLETLLLLPLAKYMALAKILRLFAGLFFKSLFFCLRTLFLEACIFCLLYHPLD